MSIGAGISTGIEISVVKNWSTAGGVGPTGDALLLETGDFILLESGGYILLES